MSWCDARAAPPPICLSEMGLERDSHAVSGPRRIRRELVTRMFVETSSFPDDTTRWPVGISLNSWRY